MPGAAPTGVGRGWRLRPRAVVDEAYAYRLPDGFDDEHAPLLCAGIIGYRSLRRAEVPPGGRLGIYGFQGVGPPGRPGGAAEGATVHVLTRSAEAQALPSWVRTAGGADDEPPEPLDAAILFAPAGDLVPVAPRRPRSRHPRGGRHPPQRRPPLDYQRHLFQERQVRSVTANTRADGEEFLTLAGRLDCTWRPRPTPSTPPTGRWPTWPPTG